MIFVKEEPLYLDKNENAYGPSPKCSFVLRRASMRLFNSYPREAVHKLRQRLSEKFQVDESRIMLGYGSEDILKQALYYGLLPRKRKILLPKQSWWYYRGLADELDAEVGYYEIKEEETQYTVDLNEILKRVKESQAKVVILCSPNNPTGDNWKVSYLEKFLENNPNCLVILDQAYWGFVPEDNSYLQNFVERFPRLVIIRSFSKYYALAGIRIGFAFIGDHFKLVKRFNERYLGYNRLSEEMALAAISSENYYQQVAKRILKNNRQMINEFRKIDGVKAYASAANFVFLKILRAELLEALQNVFEKQTIIVKFLLKDPWENNLRITTGTERQTNRLLRVVKQTAQKLGLYNG
ncbi:MAG: histidinol-phosphate transaminase [Candidatus Edwardsbacteria bacterium]